VTKSSFTPEPVKPSKPDTSNANSTNSVYKSSFTREPEKPSKPSNLPVRMSSGGSQVSNQKSSQDTNQRINHFKAEIRTLVDDNTSLENEIKYYQVLVVFLLAVLAGMYYIHSEGGLNHFVPQVQ
jgi:hypothetical protein